MELFFSGNSRALCARRTLPLVERLRGHLQVQGLSVLHLVNEVIVLHLLQGSHAGGQLNRVCLYSLDGHIRPSGSALSTMTCEVSSLAAVLDDELTLAE